MNLLALCKDIATAVNRGDDPMPLLLLATSFATVDERERCARIAADERVAAHETNEETDLSYNQACDDIAAKIREKAK